MRKKKSFLRMRDAISTSEKSPFKHIVSTIMPSESRCGDHKQNWHGCDKVSDVYGLGGGGS